jgi:hypothetical protein
MKSSGHVKDIVELLISIKHIVLYKTYYGFEDVAQW